MAGHLARFSVAGLVLAIGCALVWFSLPRLFSSLYVSNYGKVLEELSAGRDVNPPYLALTAKAYTVALQWLADGGLWVKLGEIRLAQAKAAGFKTPKGMKYLGESIEAQKAGLALRPSQPYAWTQLAHATMLKEGAGPALAPLLKMAITTGPYEPKLVLTRVELGLVAWPFLNGETKNLVSGQIRLAARYYPDRLARATKQRHGLRIVHRALLGHANLMRRFTSLYLRL